MKGFDPQFRDFPTFLRTVSRDLWEERGLSEPLERYVHPQAVLRAADGIAFGPMGVGARVLALLAACPNAQMLNEDVIWSGDPQVGMLGSQRTMAMGNHHGPGLFGAPTGKSLRFRVLGDYYAKDGRISDGWEVRDTTAILRQLSLDPQAWARAQLDRGVEDSQPLTPEADVQGPYTASGNANQWGVAFGDLLKRVMQGAFSVIPDQYDRACQMEYPGGRTAHGTAAADAFWLGLRGSFPSAEFTLHHRIGMEEPLLPPRAALRWSLTGAHDGWGLFGAPTGARVHIMGISHAEFGPNGLRREWTLIDEAAIWAQILQQTG